MHEYARLTPPPRLSPSRLYYSLIFRYITDFGVNQVPTANSSLEGLLNRSSLIDVPLLGMQRQHELAYMAALDDPSPAAGDVSDINFQAYAGFNMEASGYRDFTEVCAEGPPEIVRASLLNRV